MKKIAILLLLLSSLLWASSSIGSATGQFLEISLHVRNMGMGNAGTSLVNGASAAMINPAGIVDLSEDSEFDTYMSYVKWPADISFGAVGAAYRVRSIGVFSVNAKYAYFGDEVRTSPEQPFGDGTFSMGAMSLGLSYARNLTDKFSFGLTVKHVSENYDNSSYSQIAWDMGTLFRTGYRNLNLGMSILHFSKEAQFDGKFLDYSDQVKYALGDSSKFSNWPLPITFRTGLSMDALNTESMQAKIALDMIHSNNSDEIYGFGAELNYLNKYSIRTGYQYGTDIQGFSLGGGLKFVNNIRIDYAFNTMEYFGPRHRFSFGLDF